MELRNRNKPNDYPLKKESTPEPKPTKIILRIKGKSLHPPKTSNHYPSNSIEKHPRRLKENPQNRPNIHKTINRKISKKTTTHPPKTPQLKERKFTSKLNDFTKKVMAIAPIPSKNTSDTSEDEEYSEINVPGELVLAYRKKLWYPAKVVIQTKDEQYKVLFYDETYSKLPRDKLKTLYDKGFKDCKMDKDEILKHMGNSNILNIKHIKGEYKDNLKQLYYEIESKYKKTLDLLWNLSKNEIRQYSEPKEKHSEIAKFVQRAYKFFYAEQNERKKFLGMHDRGKLSYEEYSYITLLVNEWYCSPPKLWTLSKANSQERPSSIKHVNSNINDTKNKHTSTKSAENNDGKEIKENHSYLRFIKVNRKIISKKTGKTFASSDKYNKSKFQDTFSDTESSSGIDGLTSQNYLELKKTNSLHTHSSTTPELLSNSTISPLLLSLSRDAAAEHFCTYVLIPCLVEMLSNSNIKKKSDKNSKSKTHTDFSWVNHIISAKYIS
ncbi:hypothetical protein BB559_002139 [Furculomyces boomerangus]|uniref:Uncharacterized protein n=1 Tax=Furculomyces boomerangus TaxID=61424 RepID=A0A2T9YXT3_9FUNG|nr:hypothetical protein BB559_002139 [Furculomyces boomerangus]